LNASRRALLLAGLAAGGASARPTLRVATGEYPPYSGAQLPDQGVFSALIRAAIEQAGWQLQLQFMPWNRTEAAVESGEVDASGPWGRTPARDARFRFSERVATLDWRWLARRADGFDGTLAQLRRQRIALVRSYTYTPALWTAVHEGGLQTQFVATDLAGLSLLQQGRIDLLPVDRYTGCQLALEQLAPAQQPQLTLHDGPLLGSYGVHLLFARTAGGARRAAAFNQGLREVLRTGLRERLFGALQCPLALPGTR